MILVETLEDLVHNYLEDPTRPGSTVGKVNAQDLVGHVAQHLTEFGVDVGFADGSRLTLAGTTLPPPEPRRHRLPLVLQENDDGHVRIYCDSRDCVWSWPLYKNAPAQANGDSITNAVQHALRRHGHA
ncbi:MULTISPECIES: hypothetical protein [Pseudonocardiaceae]|uniref:DUF302 domain-containing protein n=2 Tax=Pseudonocardiaceae TaxID=2070 RepID=A0ABY2RX94_9PSEU|nr:MULTISPECIES: hypothetical protein [Pseudonocardiaceae]TKG62374.1 hypothetical protein FCN18_32190 [Prauserella endophytica]WIV57899.1 hypothetical protein QP939_04235 [Amycolatopsis sp. 2-2]